MHIPPYYKRKSWQHFIIGICTGALISYTIIIFMYGTMYEKLYESNLELQSMIDELKSQNNTLLEDKKEFAEKDKAPLIINRIEVHITNQKELHLDRLIVHQLDKMIKQEINHLIGQDIKIVSESDQLLLSSIENKSFKVDDFTYVFEVKRLTISETIKLMVYAKISD